MKYRLHYYIQYLLYRYVQTWKFKYSKSLFKGFKKIITHVNIIHAHIYLVCISFQLRRPT